MQNVVICCQRLKQALYVRLACGFALLPVFLQPLKVVQILMYIIRHVHFAVWLGSANNPEAQGQPCAFVARAQCSEHNI
jgi:hypothetical protein